MRTKCIDTTRFILTYDNCYKKIARGNDPFTGINVVMNIQKEHYLERPCARVLRRFPLVHAQKTFISWTAMLAAFLHCKYLLPNMRSVMPPQSPNPSNLCPSKAEKLASQTSKRLLQNIPEELNKRLFHIVRAISAGTFDG